MLSNVGAAAASRSGVWCSQRSMARHSTAVARLLAPPRLALAQRQGPCVCGLAVRIHASKRLFSGSSAHGGAPRAAPRVEKPRAATTPARAKRSQAGVVAALAAAGLLGTAGYQMYTWGTSPAEYIAELQRLAATSLRDVSDPEPEFMRNCLTPAAMLEKQGFRGTVLLDMEGTLLARKWDRVHGYRFSKRPFADEFLIMLSQMGYEIVLFSDSPVAVGNETADKLVRHFPPGSISCNGVLAREHMIYRNGRYVKDLSMLPRDHKRLVLVDDDKHSFERNPDNTILVSSYTEYDASDDALRKVIALLAAMQSSGKDYPDFLREYSGRKDGARAAPASGAGQPALRSGAPSDESNSGTTASSSLPHPSGSAEETSPVDPSAVIKNFADEAERKADADAEKRKSGLGGLLRSLKGRSTNLQRGKVVSPGALTFEEVMATRSTNAAGDGSLFGAKMARLHKRQSDWEEQQKAAQAAASAGESGGTGAPR